MTETKHSPGPWTIVRGEEGVGIEDANGNTLLSDEAYYPCVILNEADWYLIAAAPELLAALKGLIPFPPEPREIANNIYEDGDGLSVFMTMKDITRARAAIAKAEGKTSASISD